MAPKRKTSSGKRGKAAASKKKATGRHGKRAHAPGAAASASAAAKKLYEPTDLILVLGDGDFTFSRGLIKHRGTGDGVFATSFDSEATVRSKYANAQQCINDIRSLGARVLHDVDATRLDELPIQLKGSGAFVPTFFQYVVFNFPHSGEQRVHVNRVLLRDFFASARTRLFAHGEAHVTLKTTPPYSNWLVEEQAHAAGFVLKERRAFDVTRFPGYQHRTTDPTAKVFDASECVTYVFVVNRAKHPFHVIAQAATDAAHRRKLSESTGADAVVAPQAPAEDTVIAQLLAEHARVKAEAARRQSNEPTALLPPCATRATTSSNSSAGCTSAVASAAVVQLQQPKQQALRVAAQLWTPLHRRPLVLFGAAVRQTQQSR